MKELKKLKFYFEDLNDMGIKTPSIAGEIGERIIAEMVNGELAKFNQKGYDVLESDGTKRQVKTRVDYGDYAHSTIIFDLKDNDWDIADLIIIDPAGEVIRHEEISKEMVRELAWVTAKGTLRMNFGKIDKHTVKAVLV